MFGWHIQQLEMAKNHRFFQFTKWIKGRKRFKTKSAFFCCCSRRYFSCANCLRCWQRVVCLNTTALLKPQCMPYVCMYVFFFFWFYSSGCFFPLVLYLFCRHHTSLHSYIVRKCLQFSFLKPKICMLWKFVSWVVVFFASDCRVLISTFLAEWVYVCVDFLGVVRPLFFRAMRYFRSIRAFVFSYIIERWW